MNLNLNGKRALVSASSSGIGYSIALRLAKEGAEVILNGRSDETVKAALTQAEEEAPEANFLTLVADLGTATGAQQAVTDYPDVDILVNNLGIYWPAEFAEITDEDWNRIFEVNVMSGVRLTRHYFPRMLKADWGRVIFIASESGIMIPKEMIHYGFSKSAQLAISSGLAQHTKGTGVTVNSVLPGPTQTDNVIEFMKSVMPGAETKSADEVGRDFIKEHRPSSLLGRLIDPDEIASLVAFVASPLSAAINGAALRTEGGLVQSII